MGELASIDRWMKLVESVDRLTAARSNEEVIDRVRESARTIAAADGITFVRREGDRVRYVAENAISPLWTGQSFPMEQCISGIAMIERAPVVIPDIALDPRVPMNAYLSTFVRSMAMFPVGVGEPNAAIGAYWRDVRRIDPETVRLLGALARSTGAALDNIEVLREANEICGTLRAAG